jgi:3-phenylpropionate/cinnamic acid dioxygenase small subunit
MTDHGTTERAISDQEAIRATLAAYCQTLDDGRFDEWVDLLTEEIAFAVMGRVDRGRAAVRAFVEPVQQADSRGRHVLSEPLISLEGDTATATTDFCFLAPDLTVTAAGRYHDVLVRDADRWRIATREIVFLGEAPRGIPDPGDGPGDGPDPDGTSVR